MDATGSALTTLVLAASDIRRIVDEIGRDHLMDLMIGRLRSRCAELLDSPSDTRDRDGFRYDKPSLGLVEWMPTHEAGGPVVVKMVGYHPTNPVQRHLPSVISTTSMWDTVTGHLMAIADSTLLTAVRTGAASAIATDLLTDDGPVTLGIIGLGAQAVTQAHAISRVRRIERILAFDVDDDVADSFGRRVDFLGVDVVRCGDADDVRTASDVLCTCTSVDIGAGPVVPDGAHRPGLHVNAVGADFPGKTELPRSFLERAFVVPDVRSQCRAEGECQQLDEHHIGPDLVELVRTPGLAHRRRGTLSVYDSTGWAVQDAVALRLVLDLAARIGAGRSIELELLPTDPFDPYTGGSAPTTPATSTQEMP
jgi:ornithine cyclodeaminase/alanine dehydrogenase-like protein (mu-crystallin family)